MLGKERIEFSFGDPRLTVGPYHKTVIVAEVGQAHDGSLGIAHSFIDRAADVGVDIIKFQTHIARAESTLEEPFRVRFSYEDATRYDYWRRMEFTPEQWAGLMRHARDREVLFLSSPFSAEAVGMLDKLGMAAWKVGSGEVNNHELLSALARTGKPVLISSGMSGYEEIDLAAQTVRRFGNPFMLLQCTSMYPTPLEKVGLNVFDRLVEHGVPIGLSDHSGTVYPALAAMAMGIDLVEVHVTFDRKMFGIDNSVSLTFEEIELLVKARDAFHVLAQSPVDKDAVVDELKEMRACFNKSVALRKDLPAGTTITRDLLTVKKPGTGIPASELDSLAGRILRRDKRADVLLAWDDFE